MIELKPRCAGCGTGNAIDADYCMECGIKFIREKNNENSLDNVFGISAVFRDDNDMSIPNEPFEEITIRKGLDGRYEDEKSLPKLQPTTYEDIGFEYNNGKYEIFDGNDNNKILFESSNLEETKERLEIIMKSMNVEPISKCDHTLSLVANHHCECVRCIKCGKRTETCFKHIPKFDYALQTKKKNSLDHLKESLSPKTPFPVDKRLDFRSNQIADYHFKDECNENNCTNRLVHHGYPDSSKQEMKKKVDDLGWKVPLIEGGIIKVPDATPKSSTFFFISCLDESGYP